MVLVYLLREYVVLIIYPDFTGLYPLFKWQLAGDFVRLAAMVLMYQFLAKKLVRAYVVAELGSLLLFYLGARFLVEPYGIEGVVMAHALRYVLFLPLVFFLVERNFRQIRRRLNG